MIDYVAMSHLWRGGARPLSPQAPDRFTVQSVSGVPFRSSPGLGDRQTFLTVGHSVPSKRNGGLCSEGCYQEFLHGASNVTSLGEPLCSHFRWFRWLLLAGLFGFRLFWVFLLVPARPHPLASCLSVFTWGVLCGLCPQPQPLPQCHTQIASKCRIVSSPQIRQLRNVKWVIHYMAAAAHYFSPSPWNSFFPSIIS